MTNEAQLPLWLAPLLLAPLVVAVVLRHHGRPSRLAEFASAGSAVTLLVLSLSIAPAAVGRAAIIVGIIFVAGALMLAFFAAVEAAMVQAAARLRGPRTQHRTRPATAPRRGAAPAAHARRLELASAPRRGA